MDDLAPLPPDLALDEEPLSVDSLVELDVTLELIDRWRDLTEDEVAAPEAVQWEITDDGAAEWTLRHVAAIDKDLARWSDQRDDWQRRIDLWFEQNSAPQIRRRAFFTMHLKAYAAARREADPAHKTLALPSGRVTSKHQPARVKVLNDETVAAWLAEHGITVGPDGADLVVTTAKVYAVPLRKTLRPVDGGGAVVVETGERLEELPPGLVVEPEHVVYDVKPTL